MSNGNCPDCIGQYVLLREIAKGKTDQLALGDVVGIVALRGELFADDRIEIEGVENCRQRKQESYIVFVLHRLG